MIWTRRGPKGRAPAVSGLRTRRNGPRCCSTAHQPLQDSRLESMRAREKNNRESCLPSVFCLRANVTAKCNAGARRTFLVKADFLEGCVYRCRFGPGRTLLIWRTAFCFRQLLKLAVDPELQAMFDQNDDAAETAMRAPPGSAICQDRPRHPGSWPERRRRPRAGRPASRQGAYAYDARVRRAMRLVAGRDVGTARP